VERKPNHGRIISKYLALRCNETGCQHNNLADLRNDTFCVNTFYWCLFGEGVYEPARSSVTHIYISFRSFLVLAPVYLLILGVEVSVGGILTVVKSLEYKKKKKKKKKKSN